MSNIFLYRDIFEMFRFIRQLSTNGSNEATCILGLYFLHNDDNTVQDLSCCFICSVLICETLCLIVLFVQAV